MGAYTYKEVAHRDDFQAAIPEWEKEEGCEADSDAGYDGSYWSVAAFLLDKKDAEIARERARAEAAEAELRGVDGALDVSGPNIGRLIRLTRIRDLAVDRAFAKQTLNRVIAERDAAWSERDTARAALAAAEERERVLREALTELVERRERAARQVGGSMGGSDGRYDRARAALAGNGGGNGNG